MQSPEEIERNARVTYTMGRIMLIFCLLISLDNIWTVEHTLFAGKLSHTGNNWHIETLVLFPWVMLAIAGLGLWLNAKRGRLNRTIAGGLLMAASVTVSSSYQVLDKILAKALALVS
jgi:hypothetical protein